MADFLPTIRNAVRAVIIRDGRVLLLRKQYEDGSELFALPGGGQETGESLEDSLRRECREEIGTDIVIHQLVHVADFFKDRETSPPSRRHLVEMLFLCSVPTDYVAQNGPEPDKHQVGVVWVAQSALASTPIRPHSLAGVLHACHERLKPVYIGTLNTP
jgi:ADP-ribose pyrophosphatase YjhB (NUDIX family)